MQMTGLVAWLEAHDGLAGWAQTIGAIVALGVTYFTAFAPSWRRKRQLTATAQRLLLNGYEMVESYHRTSANFLPFPLSLRLAALSMDSVIGEISRFPIYELDDQGSRSTARHITAVGMKLAGLKLYLEEMAVGLETREATSEDHDNIREFVGEQLEQISDIITGKPLVRPIWPVDG